jgi:RND family efflux transporter MFP subunit
MRTIVSYPPMRAGFFLGAALLASLLSACSRPAAAPEPVRAVKLLTVAEQPQQAQLEYAGEVRARIETALGFQVAGKLVRRTVELGQAVQPGQLLAQIDAQDYALAAQAAQAQLAAAATQRDLAAAELKRFTPLKEQNFISGAELERRQAQYDAAQAQWQQARAQAQAQGNQQGYTRLLAGAPGVVTAIEAEPGQVLAAGQPVLRVAQDGLRDAVFAVPEDEVGQMQVGQKVLVRAWSGGATWRAVVRDVAASADRVTRTFTVKAALGGEALPPLGATVYVRPAALETVGQPALLLPTSALFAQGQQTAVWLFDPASSTVRAQVIEVARQDGNQVVVAAGLAAGNQVVATGVHVLAPGQKVSVYEKKTTETVANQASAAIKKIVDGTQPQ